MYMCLIKNKYVQSKEWNVSELSCYLINLDRNKDRLGHFKRMYYQSDLSDKTLYITRAIDGKKLTLDEIKDYMVPELIDTLIYIDNTGMKPEGETYLTRGMLGCYLSHLNIYQRFLETDEQYCMIFEDDAIFDKDIYKKIQYYISYTPDDWDIILMGYVYTFDTLYVNHNINKVFDFWGLQGYIITRKGMEKILKYINVPIRHQIDFNMSDLAKQNILEIYAPNESHVKQQGYSTDVQIV